MLAGRIFVKTVWSARVSVRKSHPVLFLLRRSLLRSDRRFRRLEANLRMGAIAKRLLRRCATAAQRHRRLALQVDLRAIHIDQPDRPFHPQRSVGLCRDRHICICHLKSLPLPYKATCYFASRRRGFCIGTTCTVTSRTSARKRLITDPRKRMSILDRADCPKTTCERPSCWANWISAFDTFLSFNTTTFAPRSRASRWYSSIRCRPSASLLSSSGVSTRTAYQMVERRDAMRAPARSSRSVPGRGDRHTITFSGIGACSSP